MLWQKGESGVGTLGRRQLAQSESGKQEKVEGEEVWSAGQENRSQHPERRLLREPAQS